MWNFIFFIVLIWQLILQFGWYGFLVLVMLHLVLFIFPLLLLDLLGFLFSFDKVVSYFLSILVEIRGRLEHFGGLFLILILFSFLVGLCPSRTVLLLLMYRMPRLLLWLLQHLHTLPYVRYLHSLRIFIVAHCAWYLLCCLWPIIIVLYLYVFTWLTLSTFSSLGLCGMLGRLGLSRLFSHILGQYLVLFRLSLGCRHHTVSILLHHAVVTVLSRATLFVWHQFW